MSKKTLKTVTNVSKLASGKREDFDIDDVDRRILKVLISNPRASLRELSAAVGKSVGTVREHLSYMYSRNLIKGYGTIVDPKTFGYKITAIIGVFERKESIGSLKQKLAGLPNVFGFYATSGQMDAIILARFHDTDELNNFVKSILRMKHILRTETMLVLDTYKEDFRVMF